MILLAASVVVVAGLASFLWLDSGSAPYSANGSTTSLFFYCAAGVRVPINEIATAYEDEFGVTIDIQFGGSNTLLSQIEVARTGDLYLAADESYLTLAREKGLLAERLPVASMRPVIAVPKGNPKNIRNVEDLLQEGIRVALGNPDQAAVGKRCRKVLSATGQWDSLEARTKSSGVFLPTVNEVANVVKLGSVDAAVIWDAVAAQYPELEVVVCPEFEAAAANIEIGVLASSRNPTEALRFARYLAARDRGLNVFGVQGYETVAGDVWAETPELIFYAGSVNRRALEPIVSAFEAREGVDVSTVYNGCGILTAQMRTIDQDQKSGFPDVYMACDVYYLDTVADWFQDRADVSTADIVIVVQEGNPKNIQSLADLTRPGVRVAIGQPEQCTIGVLTRKLLEAEGVYDQLLENNVVTETATSALLVPNITTGSADAVLAYVTDTIAEEDKLDVVPIDSPHALAVQPFSIARSSDHKFLGRRLFEAIARSQDSFESAGFNWRLDTSSLAPPAGTNLPENVVAGQDSP